MFEGPQEEQSKKLAAMLSTMIRGLDRLENIKPAVRALGRRHIDYGVRPMDYTIFWNALLDTLETFLKDEFDNETRNAWMTFYRHMTSMMLSTTKWQEPIDRYGRRVA